MKNLFNCPTLIIIELLKEDIILTDSSEPEDGYDPTGINDEKGDKWNGKGGK